jgi:hypothetical protein
MSRNAILSIRRRHSGAFTSALRLASFLAATFFVQVVTAQEAGWRYSPLPGEGDRATLGCADGSNEQSYSCVAVRCEDDWTTGIYIHTSRTEGDQGDWLLTIDRENRTVSAAPGLAPYGAKIAQEESEWLLERLKEGTFIYLQPKQGTQPEQNPVPLGGSLYAINQALAYCAPRVQSSPTSTAEPSLPEAN